MSYTPTNWQSGDIITAEKLNKMEGGINSAANPFVVTLTPTEVDFSGTMDKTPGEIHEAYVAGKEIRISVPSMGGLVGICTEFSPDVDSVSLWCNFTANFPELGGFVMIVVITSTTTATYSTHITSLT